MDLFKLTWAAVFRSVYGTTPVMSSLPTHLVMSKSATGKKEQLNYVKGISEQGVYNSNNYVSNTFAIKWTNY